MGHAAVSSAESKDGMMLTKSDIDLHAQLKIDQATLESFGVRRVDDREARELLAINRPYGRLDGVIYPYRLPGQPRAVGHRLRRDHPEIENDKPKNKYLSGYGDRRHLYFGELNLTVCADTSIQAVLVESEKAALAVGCSGKRLGRAVLPIALGGCWSWRGRIGKVIDAKGAMVDETGVLPDFWLVDWTQRDAVIVYDTNCAVNKTVQWARHELAKVLADRGARVRFADLPVENGINGPDDFLGRHDDAEFWKLVDAAKSWAMYAVKQRPAPPDDDMPTMFTADDGRYTLSVLDGTVEFI